MTHDFKRFPELTNNQMDFYYWESPHRQITESFDAEVVKVSDGDTIRVKWRGRDFDFPVRFANTAAPELDEKGGIASQSWLEKQILGKTVEVGVNKFNRVEKWGRLLGYISFGGLDMGELSAAEGHSITWEDFESATA